MNDDLLLKSKANSGMRLGDSINQLQRTNLLEREGCQIVTLSLDQVNICQPWAVLKSLYYLFLSKRSTYNLINNWSVAELNISEQEYQFLYNWLILSPDKPSHGFLKSVLAETKIIEGKITYKQVFGLALFIFECEFIRRNCSNEEVWGTLSQLLKDSCCRALFNSAGQATADHKNLIKDIVITFDMRNIFNNIDDTQSWFDTFFLQIGFPRRGIRNLPNWLYHANLTYALKILLNSGDLNYSSSFKTFFEALKEIRTIGIIDQDSLKVITSSPWILQEWVSEIITLISNDNDFNFYNSISTKVRLSNDIKPVFLVEVMFYNEDVREDKIFIECNGIKQCYLRNDQGKYQDLEHSNTFNVPFIESSDVMDIYVYDKRGVLIAEKELVLWGEEEEVVLFNTQGKRLELKDKVQISQITYAIMPNDLRIEPETQCIKGLEFDLYKLGDCNTQTYDVFLDECLIWSSKNILSNDASYAQTKLHIRNIELKPSHEYQNSFSLVLQHNSEIIIREMIFETRSISFKSNSTSKTISDSFIITKRAGDEIFKIKYEYKKQLYTLRKKLIIPKVGVLSSYRRQSFIALNHNDHLTLNQLRDSRFKIFHQNKLSYNTQDLFYIEGGTILYKFKDKLQKGIKQCVGYGGSLLLRSNPINDMDRNDIPISRCVLDTGVIAEVKLNGRRFSIKLISNIDPSLDHKVVCLANDAQLHLIDNIIVSKDGSWKIEVTDGNIACIGIVYKSQIIGQFWIKDNWLAPLESAIDISPSDIKKIAMFYRCFKAPLLYSDNELKQRGRSLLIISQNFVAIISAWLSPTNFFDFGMMRLDIKPIVDDKDWHNVLAEIFWFFDFNRIDIKTIREDLILHLQEESQIYSREVEQWAGVFMLLSLISPFFFSYMLDSSEDLLGNSFKQISMLIKHQLECQFRNSIEQTYGSDYNENDLLKQIYILIGDKYYYMEETFIKDTIDYAAQINQRIKSKNDIFGFKYYIEEFENTQADTNRIKLIKNNLQFLLKDNEFRDLLSLKLMERIGTLCLN